MDLDWIALYGAILSTGLAVSGLYRWIRAKPEERVSKVKAVLEKMIGPISDVEEHRHKPAKD